jgi:crossover junction endodeoxyribonuclease RusA
VTVGTGGGLMPSSSRIDEPFATTFQFDWTSPPLHLNQRWRHWAMKAKVTREVRSLMHAKARMLPEMQRIDVHLVWVVATKHRRDGINSTPTLKALVDGLVDAEVIPDDTPEFLSDHIPEIRYEKGALPHFELTVRQIA